MDPLESKLEATIGGEGLTLCQSMFLSVGSEPVRSVAKGWRVFV